jgi:hypothetical protein
VIKQRLLGVVLVLATIAAFGMVTTAASAAVGAADRVRLYQGCEATSTVYRLQQDCPSILLSSH